HRRPPRRNPLRRRRRPRLPQPRSRSRRPARRVGRIPV
ncbi:MAG: hypothetical protein AVDCRST_MAG77-2440, partial [uncultured Chloroflexi bacterium]